MADCGYTSDPETMERWLCQAAFWIVREPVCSDHVQTVPSTLKIDGVAQYVKSIRVIVFFAARTDYHVHPAGMVSRWPPFVVVEPERETDLVHHPHCTRVDFLRRL